MRPLFRRQPASLRHNSQKPDRQRQGTTVSSRRMPHAPHLLHYASPQTDSPFCGTVDTRSKDTGAAASDTSARARSERRHRRAGARTRACDATKIAASREHMACAPDLPPSAETHRPGTGNSVCSTTTHRYALRRQRRRGADRDLLNRPTNLFSPISRAALAGTQASTAGYATRGGGTGTAQRGRATLCPRPPARRRRFARAGAANSQPVASMRVTLRRRLQGLCMWLQRGWRRKKRGREMLCLAKGGCVRRRRQAAKH